MGVKDEIIKASGATALSNEAYAQYERVMNVDIIERDSNGNLKYLPDGGYSLINSSDRVGGAVDAYRHAYTSAVMARDYGSNFAHWVGDMNEFGEGLADMNSKDGRELNMDYWNNSVGRTYSGYGDRNTIASAIGADLHGGSFITNVHDLSNPSYSGSGGKSWWENNSDGGVVGGMTGVALWKINAIQAAIAVYDIHHGRMPQSRASLV